MKNYRKVLKNRIRSKMIFVMVMLLLIIIINTTNNVDPQLDIIRGLCTGIAIAVELLLVVQIAKYGRTLKDEKSFKKYYYYENDERRVAIRQKAMEASLQIGVGLILIFGIIGSYWSRMITITAFLSVVILAIIKLVPTWYYNKKM